MEKSRGAKAKGFRIAALTAGIAAIVVLTAAVVFIAYAVWCRSTGRLVRVGGYSAVCILSSSMEPEIGAGDYILIRRAATDSLAVGDVITFYDPSLGGRLNTHRIVRIIETDEKRAFVTQGDANDLPDGSAVSEENVAGVYVGKLPVLTALAEFFSHKAVLWTLVLVPSSFLIAYCTVQIVRTVRSGGSR